MSFMMDDANLDVEGTVGETSEETSEETTATTVTAVTAEQVLPASPASLMSPTPEEVQQYLSTKFDFEMHRMHVEATLNNIADKLLGEIASLKRSPPPISIIPPPAVPPNYQQMYIDSLLQRIDSLERTVANQNAQMENQHAQMMLLIESTAPPECTPASVENHARPGVHTPAAPAQKPHPSAKGAAPPTPRVNPPPPSTSNKTRQPPKSKRVEIVGDSMLGGLHGWSKPGYFTKVNSFGGATSLDAVDMAGMALRRQPDMLIVHTGTNDFDHDEKTKTQMQRIISKARNVNPDIILGISAICHREDRKNLQPKIKDMNNQLKNFCKQQQVIFIEHSDFDHSCLARKGLHPNENGSTSIKQDFDRTITSSLV